MFGNVFPGHRLDLFLFLLLVMDNNDNEGEVIIMEEDLLIAGRLDLMVWK